MVIIRRFSVVKLDECGKAGWRAIIRKMSVAKLDECG
jgi:hypothetical protein